MTEPLPLPWRYHGLEKAQMGFLVGMKPVYSSLGLGGGATGLKP